MKGRRSDNDLGTHLREYLECLTWKGSLGCANVSCKSIREATHQIKTPCRSAAASVSRRRRIYLQRQSIKALVRLRAPVWISGAGLRAWPGLTWCMSEELLRMLTFSVLEVPTRVAGKT